MKKERIKRIVYFILVLIWMMIVFMFSNENGEKSSNTSGKFTEQIVKIFVQDEMDKIELVSKLEPIMRKLAHFTLYTIGGILIFNYINTFKIKTKNKLILTLIIGMLYASSDEIHQYFVSNRGARITDVLIDSSGVVTGIIIYYNILKKLIKIK